jgi:TolA-binding protein
MCLLNKTQVELIEKDVEQASITLSHLADDLIDHICCEVEDLMSQHQTFEEAYEKVKQQSGISVLKKIQDDTQFLIDKNYRIMKSFMKVIGNISLALIMFGTVFKIMHWPGASIILTVGFASVCAIFFPLAVYVNYKKVSQSKNLVLHIVLLISGITFMAGVIFKIMHWPFGTVLLFFGYLSLIVVALPLFLITKVRSAKDKKDKNIYILGFLALMIFASANMFKFFHWPGAAILLLVGAFLLVSIFLPLYTWRSIKKEGKITGQYIYTIIVSMFLVMFTSLMALNVSENHLQNFVDHGNNEKSIAAFLKDKNNAYANSLIQKPDSLVNTEQIIHINKKAEEISHFIEQVQEEMLQKVEHTNNRPIEYLKSHTNLINYKTNEKEVYEILIGDNADGKAYQLKELLQAYKNELLQINSDNKEYQKSIENLIDLSNKIKWGRKIMWEHYHLYSVMLIDALATLDEIEAKARNAESLAIDQLKKSVTL